MYSSKQRIPSFQSFVKRMPPVERQQQESQPGPSYTHRRTSSISIPRSSSRSRSGIRRSSSVYSRTVSQWRPGEIPWERPDFANAPRPPLPILQPLAYSASTPQLVERQPTPPLLEPRVYRPIISTPSPSASRATTPSPARSHKPSMLLPEPLPTVKISKKHLRTISLEKAKAAVNAPGAVHLLPEELRAQTLGRSRSHEPMRLATADGVGGTSPPELPQPPTLVDYQGRQRAIQPQSEISAAAPEYPFPIVDRVRRESSHGFDKMPYQNQQHLPSYDEVDEPRGRTRYRTSREMSNPYVLTKPKRISASSSPGDTADAQHIANEYHDLLTEQYQRTTERQANDRNDSEESVKTHMRMIPQPLFQKKPPAALPTSTNGYGSDSDRSVSPYYLRNGSGMGGSLAYSSNSSNGSFPLRVSTQQSRHRRTSTSGSIPISPPTSSNTPSPLYSPPPDPDRFPKPIRPKIEVQDKHVSQFYPHIAPRKGTKGKSKLKAGANGTRSSPMPTLPAKIPSPKFNTIGAPVEMFSPTTTSTRAVPTMGTSRRRSDESAYKTRQPFHQRFAKGAVKYADLLTKPTDAPDRRDPHKTIATAAAPESPHLLPSPTKKPEVHLGWSDASKDTFDQVMCPVSPTRPQPDQSYITHVAAPARPLDESRVALREIDSPRRKSSIFGSFLESWKESKAEKRREELKKIIKVVQQGEVAAIQRRSSTFGWM